MIPIANGEARDASSADIRIMKRRTYVLNKQLRPIIHRRAMDILEKELQPKREFTLYINMTGFQKFLYKLFLAKLKDMVKGRVLFVAYQSLRRIWNHPGCQVSDLWYTIE